MNTVMTDKHGNILNMQMVMNDNNDSEGKKIIIRHVNELEQGIAQLEDALHFYANENNWIKGRVFQDKGELARDCFGENYTSKFGKFQGKRWEVLTKRHNGHFNVLAIMNVETFEMQWCPAEDFKYD